MEGFTGSPGRFFARDSTIMDASATSIYPSLANKTVLISGGGSGIGAAFTRAFAERGSRVAFVDVAQETSEALVDELNAEGATKPLFLACDVATLRRCGIP